MPKEALKAVAAKARAKTFRVQRVPLGFVLGFLQKVCSHHRGLRRDDVDVGF